MNRRPFLKGLLAGWFSLGTLFGVSLAPAQEEQTAPRQQRGNLRTPDMRVEQDLDPRLEQLLFDWSSATAKIKTLQGEHHRFVYDKVFEVDKRAKGRFYYEAPDKGRIDIEKIEIPPGTQSKMLGKDKVPYKIDIANPERWICNGQEIQVIDDTQKTVEIVPIPKENQGANIMNGPLPFLFGMPPEKAKQRYHMKLDAKMPNKILLRPKLAQDAENWREAQVILDMQTLLPTAVKLQDPAGNLETIYVFQNLVVNQRQNIFKEVVQGNVFNPRLLGYKRNVIQPPEPPPGAANGVPKVPSVAGMSLPKAKQLLERAGYVVKFEAGEPAASDDFTQVVYAQQPKENTALAPKQVVKITYYDFPSSK